jgi:hypothetical protein
LLLPPLAEFKDRAYLLKVESMAATELPDRWIGYDAADVVVARAGIFQRPMNDRLRALMEWVGSGGHLIVVPNATDSRRFHPDCARLFGMQLATTVAFEAEPVFAQRYAAAPAKAVRAVWEGKPDEVLLADAGGPLLCRKSYGLGTVSFTAIDLVGPTWRNWPGAAKLWRDVFVPSLRISRVDSRQQYGYDYHSQSIINGLRQIPALRPPSFALLALYLCLYLFVMVYVNYRVLRRHDKKEWSLFTFPAIAVCGSDCK